MNARPPSPEAIRKSIDDLRNGKLTEVEHDTRTEILELALTRVEAMLPDEIRQALASYTPQVLESYALLLRWQNERATYPQPVDVTNEHDEAQDLSMGQESLAPATRISVAADNEDEEAFARLFGTGQGQQQNVSPAPLLQGQNPRSIEIPLPPGQDPLQALSQAVTAPLIAMQQMQARQPKVTFQATTTMRLDTFQHAYKGLVTVTEGKGKRAQSKIETIAVIQAIYETEQRKLAEQGRAQEAENPNYWLEKVNNKTVYFVGEFTEVAWLLGDYDPVLTHIPAGTKPTPEQIVSYLHDPDDGNWEDEVIKMHLRTPQQKQWLDQHDLTLRDILEGREPIGLFPQIAKIFEDWNQKLGEHIYGA